MDDKQIEAKMKKLRTSMESMPSRTNKSIIMQKAHQQNNKKKHSRFLVLAGSLASLFILSLLVISTFGNGFGNSQIIPGGNKQPLELLDVQVEIHSDEARLGSTIITYGEMKGEKIVPTALTYQFSLKNIGEKTLGSLEEDEADKHDFKLENGLEVKIEPKEQLKEVSKEVMGYNLFNKESRQEHHVGSGYSGMPVMKPMQSGNFSLDFTLGASKENPELPLVPSDEKLKKLEENAYNADLVVTLKDEEIARFDLTKFR